MKGKAAGAVREHYRKAVAFLLAFVMVMSNVGSSLTTALAAERRTSLFLLSGEELYEAIREAKEEGEPFDFESLELEAKSGSLERDYEKLLGGSDVYLLPVSVDGSYALDDTDVMVFYNDRTESVVFLYLNLGEETVGFQASVDGLETKTINVSANKAAPDVKVPIPVPAVLETSPVSSEAVPGGETTAEAESKSPESQTEETESLLESEGVSEAVTGTETSEGPEQGSEEESQSETSDSESQETAVNSATETVGEEEQGEAGSSQESENGAEATVGDRESEAGEKDESDMNQEETTAAEDPGDDESNIGNQDGESGSQAGDPQDHESDAAVEDSGDQGGDAAVEDVSHQGGDASAEGASDQGGGAALEDTADQGGDPVAEDTADQGGGASAEEASDQGAGSAVEDSGVQEEEAADKAAAIFRHRTFLVATALDDKEAENHEEVQIQEVMEEEITEEEITEEQDSEEQAAEEEDSEETKAQEEELQQEEQETEDETTAQESVKGEDRSVDETSEADTEDEKTDSASDEITVAPAKGKLAGTSYNQVKIWGEVTARAYRVPLKNFGGIEKGGWTVDYTIDPVGAADVDGPGTVRDGARLSFTVKPQIGYDIAFVAANGETLESENGDYVVESVTEDLEIEIELAETTLHPEFSQSVTVNGVTVSAFAEEGILPQGTQLDVQEVTVQIEDALREKLEDEEDSNVFSVIAYDINLLLDGEKLPNDWSENGYVEVTFSGSRIQEMTKEADTLKIFSVDDDREESLSADNVSEATAQSLQLEAVGEEDVADTALENVSFQAEHFTIFVFVADSSDQKEYYMQEGDIAYLKGKENGTWSSTDPKVADVLFWEKDEVMIEAKSAGTATVEQKDEKGYVTVVYNIIVKERDTKFFVLKPEQGEPTSGKNQGYSNYYPNYKSDGGVKGANTDTGYPGGAVTEAGMEAVRKAELDGAEVYDIHGIDESYYKEPGDLGNFNDSRIIWYVLKRQNDGYHIDGYVAGQPVYVHYHDSFGGSGYWYTDGKDGKVLTGDAYEIKDYKDTGLPSRDGYVFDGWICESGDEKVEYSPGSKTTLMDSLNLYAKWKPAAVHYEVEYWYDGVIDPGKTEKKTASLGDEIKDFTDKNRIGYKLTEKVNWPLKISEDAGANVMQLYYEKDNFAYTIDYYYDNQLDPGKTKTGKELFGTVIDTCPREDRIGYRLEEFKGLPLTIGEKEEQNRIRVDYVKDEFAYTIEYYYDGFKEETISRKVPFETVITEKDIPDKNRTGYKKVTLDSLPLVVKEKEQDNVIRVEYQKDQFGYTVEYYYDGVIDETKTEEGKGTYKDQIWNYPDKSMDGYKCVGTNLPLEITEKPKDNVIRVFYKADDFNYTVEYYYDGQKAEGKTVHGKAGFGQKISEYPDGAVPGYKLTKVENLPLTVSAKPENNVIRIYYAADEFAYTVEYTYDNRGKKETKTWEGKAVYGKEIEEYPDGAIPGYKLVKEENLPLKISEKPEDNVIRIGYEIDEFDYTVEYYYDDWKAEDKTWNGKAWYGEEIKEYPDGAIPGYKLVKLENLPLKISEKPENNVIRIRYEADEFAYSVEYSYYDKETTETKTWEGKAVYGKVIEDYPDGAIPGYKLVGEDHVPLTVTEKPENNVIRVRYEIDDFDYSVEYYYEGRLAETVYGKETFGKEISEYSHRNIPGYKEVKRENFPLTITEDAGENVIKVYYIKDNFEYRVEYYYDGLMDEEKTERDKKRFETVIDNYPDGAIPGYVFEREEGLPLTVTEREESNVIRVYYTQQPPVTITYLAGEGGRVSRDSESVRPATGIPEGSIAQAEEGYVFLYWTDDEGNVVTSLEGMVVPEKNGEGIYEETVYTAHFAPRGDLRYEVRYFYDSEEHVDERVVAEQVAFGTPILYAHEARRTQGERTYALDCVKMNHDGSIAGEELTVSANADENIVEVYYEVDESGDTDISEDPDPDRPDGIPDKYQIRFTYQAQSDGRVEGIVTEVRTRPLRADGTYDIEGTVAPRAAVTPIPDEGYRLDHWYEEGHEDQSFADLDGLRGEQYAEDTGFVAVFTKESDDTEAENPKDDDDQKDDDEKDDSQEEKPEENPGQEESRDQEGDNGQEGGDNQGGDSDGNTPSDETNPDGGNGGDNGGSGNHGGVDGNGNHATIEDGNGSGGKKKEDDEDDEDGDGDLLDRDDGEDRQYFGGSIRGWETREILPEDVPLGLYQEGGSDPNTLIDDGEVPLSALPKTGQTSGQASRMMMFFSGIMMAFCAALGKKKEDEE